LSPQNAHSKKIPCIIKEMTLYRPAGVMTDDDDDIFRQAGLGGDGWWDDAVKETKRVAKKVQSSSVVRGLEKRAVKAGADVLRGAATAATDGLADSALTSLGVPELAPMADKLISKGANSLEKSGVNYLDQKIDASGRGYGGVRYMSPAGGGLRLAVNQHEIVSHDTTVSCREGNGLCLCMYAAHSCLCVRGGLIWRNHCLELSVSLHS
jgi:hypothetical protein